MEFSIRDEQTAAGLLCNQRGQGIVEYILTLIIGVSLILGGMYQLNSAFKGWATNYFGTYLACLLEAGELPSISGTGGDSGVCNQLFKPFTLAEGRPLKPGTNSGAEKGSTGTGGAASEKVAGSSTVGGGGGSYGGGRAFGRGSTSRGIAAKGSRGKGAGATFTGSTEAGDYGGGYSNTRKKLDVRVKKNLDNRFAFDDERDKPEKRKAMSSFRKPSEEGGKAPRIRVKKTDKKRDIAAQEDTGLNIPNFLRYLIIAGIIVALVVFLGGQTLQIGKSMD